MKKILLIFAITFSCMDSDAQWIALPTTSLPANPDITTLAVKDTILFAGTFGSGVYSKNNSASSWKQINNGLFNNAVLSLAVNGNTLFAGTQSAGVYKTFNNGVSWVASNSGLTNLTVKKIFVNGIYMFAGTLGGGSHLSVNTGSTWAAGNSGMADQYVNAYAVKGTTMFAGNDGSFGKQGGVYLSSNNGGTWTPVNTGLPPNTSVEALAVSPTYILAGTIGTGIYFSFNDGANWTQSNLNNYNVLSIVKSGTYYFAATSGGGVYISVNDGGTWSQVNNGLTNLSVTALATSSTHIYAATYNKVFSRTLNDITGMNETIANNVQVSIYPNPFNESATIELKGNIENKKTELTIYNALGKEIKKENDFSGQKITIQRSDMISGIYFYRLCLDNKQVTTGKLVIAD